MFTPIVRIRYATFALGCILFVGSLKSMDDKFTITFKGNHKPILISQENLKIFPKLQAAYTKGERTIELSAAPKILSLVSSLARYKDTHNKLMPFLQLAELIHKAQYNSQLIHTAIVCATEVGADDIATSLNSLLIKLGEKEYLFDANVLISFPDESSSQPTSYPLFQLLVSETLKDILEDLGITTDAIPVNVSKKNFELLLDMIHPQIFGITKPTAKMLKENMERVLKENPVIDFDGIIEAADYLRAPKKAITNGYAEVLKGITYVPSIGIFDRFSKKLQRSLSGKLLKDLLKKQADIALSMPISYKFSLEAEAIRNHPRPRISTSSTPWGFALTCNEEQSRYFDLVQKKENLLSFFVYSPEDCALSDDGSYMLIIGYTGDDRGREVHNASAFLMDLKTGKTIPVEKFDTSPATDPVPVGYRAKGYDYRALYNDYAQQFHIIATEDPGYALPSNTITFYSFDPKNTNNFTKKKFQNPLSDAQAGTRLSRGIRWYCIEKNLVGIFTNKQRAKQIIIYADNELFQCFDQENNNTWTYTSNGQVKNANFSVLTLDIPAGLPQKYRRDNYINRHYYNNVVLENTFIPDLEKIIAKKWNFKQRVPESLGPRIIETTFDPINLHVNYIKTENTYEEKTHAGIYSPFALGLPKAIRLINRAEKDILSTAYFAYHFNAGTEYKTMQKLCKNITILPEVIALYNQAAPTQPVSAPQKKLSLQEEIMKPIVLQQPIMPKPQPVQQSWGAWLTNMQQHASQLWRQPKQYMNTLYNKYKTSFLRAMALQRRRPAVNNQN